MSHGQRPSMTLMESYRRAGVMLVSAGTRAERVRACIVATRGRESRDTGAHGGASAQAAGTSTGPHVAHESGDLSVGLGSRPRRAPGVAVYRSPDARLHTHYCQSECHRAGWGCSSHASVGSAVTTGLDCGVGCADRRVESRPESVCDCRCRVDRRQRERRRGPRGARRRPGRQAWKSK